MLLNEDCVKMSVQEALDLGLVEQSDFWYFKKTQRSKFTCSLEFVQDFLAYRKTLYAVRGGPFDPILAKEWKIIWKIMENFNFEEVVRRYKVKFERSDWDKVVYQELDWHEKM